MMSHSYLDRIVEDTIDDIEPIAYPSGSGSRLAMTLSTDTETDSEVSGIQPQAARQKVRRRNLKQ